MKNKMKNLKNNFLYNLNNYFEKIKNNTFYKISSKYIPYILIPLFILYIIISIGQSEINIFNYKTIKSISLYLIIAFFISPIFILLTSMRFHFLKLILGSKSTIYKSINSVLLASSLDAFTPAKINDFARLRNEPNKKKSLYAIFLERFLDIFILTFFIFYLTNKIYFFMFFIFLILLLIIIFLIYTNNKILISFFYYAKLVIGSILITITHWFLAFRLFKNSFEIVFKSLNLNHTLKNIDLVTINKFSAVTLLSVLPLSFGGVGIREASAISIFKNIDSSVVFGSTLAYGIGVSGSITLLGIIYVIMRK